MLSKLRKYFFSGLLAFLPLALSVFLFLWVIGFADGLLGKYIDPLMKKHLGFYVPGLGLILGLVCIIIIGFIVTRYFGRKIQEAIEKIFLRLPFFKQVYPAVKEIADFFFARGKLKFKTVVLFEYPRKGIYAFGFLTNTSSQRINDNVKGKDELCNIFLPSAPGPLTGFVMVVPKKDIIFTDITVEEAVRFIMSGGVVNPQ